MKGTITKKDFYSKKVRVKGRAVKQCYFENSIIKNDKYTCFIDCYFFNCHFEYNKKIKPFNNIINECN
jgi:hypothetical protein